MEMPFGKYRGEEVENIPLDYLQWVLENVDLYSEELKEEIRERAKSGGKKTTTVEDDEGDDDGGESGGEDVTNVQEMRVAIERTIRQWYRAMVKKVRPELPGNEKEANVLNDSYKLLKELFDIS